MPTQPSLNSYPTSTDMAQVLYWCLWLKVSGTARNRCQTDGQSNLSRTSFWNLVSFGESKIVFKVPKQFQNLCHNVAYHFLLHILLSVELTRSKSKHFALIDTERGHLAAKYYVNIAGKTGRLVGKGRWCYAPSRKFWKQNRNLSTKWCYYTIYS